jgi:hypothetical protein
MHASLYAMAPWKLPVIVAALVVPIIAAFYVGGPGVGVAVGALAAVALLVVAARQRPLGPIVPPSATDARRHILVVVTRAVEDPAAVREIAGAAGVDGAHDDAEILVLAPAKSSFLDRWASDVESARQVAQQNLVATVAALAKADIVAEARVGDEDVVQAVEDQLQGFPATDVVLVSGPDDAGEAAIEAAASELSSRLEPEFHHVVLQRG